MCIDVTGYMLWKDFHQNFGKCAQPRTQKLIRFRQYHTAVLMPNIGYLVVMLVLEVKIHMLKFPGYYFIYLWSYLGMAVVICTAL